jgi:hypothetical protein
VKACGAGYGSELMHR